MMNPIFWKKVQGQTHPGRWEVVEHQIPSIKVLFETNAMRVRYGNRSLNIMFFLRICQIWIYFITEGQYLRSRNLLHCASIGTVMAHQINLKEIRYGMEIPRYDIILTMTWLHTYTDPASPNAYSQSLKPRKLHLPLSGRAIADTLAG